MSTQCSIGTPIPLSYRCADKTEFVLNVPRKPEFSGTPDILLLIRRGGGEWESKQQKKNLDIFVKPEIRLASCVLCKDKLANRDLSVIMSYGTNYWIAKDKHKSI